MDKKRVLLVDDEPDMSDVVKIALEKAGFEVETALNGVEALEKMEANAPDAVVLDVMMPEKDGYAVCKEIKNQSKYEDIPVVMLTAVADNVSSTRYSHYDGMNMEADDYIPKGSGATEEVVARVKELLGV